MSIFDVKIEKVKFTVDELQEFTESKSINIQRSSIVLLMKILII